MSVSNAAWETLRQQVKTTARARGLALADVAAAIGRGPSKLRAQLNVRKPPSVALQTQLRGWLARNDDGPPFPGPKPRPLMCAAPPAQNFAAAKNVSSELTQRLAVIGDVGASLEQRTAARRSWEYLVLRLPDHDWAGQGVRLNEAGVEGWDLEAVYGGVAYLKRVREE